jgi:dipeptidyl aminopeptidase/acylaminoacyl peptidase
MLGQEETQLTKGEKVADPKWSADGRWISYLKQGELWFYDLACKRHSPTSQKVRNCSWSPKQNLLAFMVDSTLCAIDPETGNFTNSRIIAAGVDNYSWLPDGSGFVALNVTEPEGVTDMRLFKLSLAGTFRPNPGEEFFTVPKEITENKRLRPAEHSPIRWSSDESWLAFVVSPADSLLSGSQMLCMLSSDGKRFDAADQPLANGQQFRWSPSRNKLVYLTASGKTYLTIKMETGVKGLTRLQPVSLTPKQFFDSDFEWQTDEILIISRAKEKRTSPVTEYKSSALYRINLGDRRQTQISFPAAEYRDTRPVFLKRQQQLSWIRSNQEKSDVWIANPDGSGAFPWIRDVDEDSLSYFQ